MNTFNEAMYRVLQNAKYDLLTGRTVSVKEKIYEFIYKVLEFIFEHLNINFSGDTPDFNMQAIANIFILLALALLLILLALGLNWHFRRRKKAKAFQDIFDDFKNNTMTVRELLSVAENLERTGNLREALRYQYIALILCFSENNIIYITDAMTGSQFRRAVKSAAPGFSKGVDSTVDLFNKLWFGNKTVSEAAYQAHKALYVTTIGEAETVEKTN